MVSDSSPTGNSTGTHTIEHGAAERRKRQFIMGPPSAHGWRDVRAIVRKADYDVVVLDEIPAAVSAGLVPLDELVDMVRLKPAALHLVLTGRNAPAELIDAADLVSEVQPIKHPYDKGIKAQRGTEF